MLTIEFQWYRENLESVEMPGNAPIIEVDIKYCNLCEVRGDLVGLMQSLGSHNIVLPGRIMLLLSNLHKKYGKYGKD